MNCLDDHEFLMALNLYRTKEYAAKILILDFQENPYYEADGLVISGKVSINGTSPVRRTISLVIALDEQTKELENPDNIISINKKISLTIRIRNPFYYNSMNDAWREYGEWIDFKQGVFILTKASNSVAVNGQHTISIEGQDKMSQLNGFLGGTFPASVSLHEEFYIEDNGDMHIENPIIIKIIKELLMFFGSEMEDNIIINDIPEEGKVTINYVGSSTIYMTEGTGADTSFRFDNLDGNHPRPYNVGMKIGYQSTPLTYPGELVFNAGATVVQALNTIKDTLGNYEFFYDVDGKFIWQQQKNYYKTTNVPLLNMDPAGLVFNPSMYPPLYSASSFLQEFQDAELITQISSNPDYGNIKNDFVVWGSAGKGDTAKLCRYHLAVDKKPQLDLVNKWMWEIHWKDTKNTVRYVFLTDTARPNPSQNIPHPNPSGPNADYNPAIEEVGLLGDKSYPPVGYNYTSYVSKGVTDLPVQRLAPPPYNMYEAQWREEIYRQAVQDQFIGSSSLNNQMYWQYYWAEMIAEWRLVFDVNSWDFYNDWINSMTGAIGLNAFIGWSPNAFSKPENLNWWLDFIDSTDTIGKYGVNAIGRRTLAVDNPSIKAVYYTEPQDIVFLETSAAQNQLAMIQRYNARGQKYCFYTSDQAHLFQQVSYGLSCFDQVREDLQSHLIYQTGISITALPIFYLEPNKIIRIGLNEFGITGDYIIDSISYALGQNNNMTVQAHEAMIRV